jgi:hypothetical protein
MYRPQCLLCCLQALHCLICSIILSLFWRLAVLVVSPSAATGLPAACAACAVCRSAHDSILVEAVKHRQLFLGVSKPLLASSVVRRALPTTRLHDAVPAYDALHHFFTHNAKRTLGSPLYNSCFSNDQVYSEHAAELADSTVSKTKPDGHAEGILVIMLHSRPIPDVTDNELIQWTYQMKLSRVYTDRGSSLPHPPASRAAPSTPSLAADIRKTYPHTIYHPFSPSC